MEYYKIQLVVIVSLMIVLPTTQGWGEDGHAIICRIAQVTNYFHSLYQVLCCASKFMYALSYHITYFPLSMNTNSLASAIQPQML